MISLKLEQSIPKVYHKNTSADMSKKILYTNFTTTEELVETLLGKTEIKKAITRNNLYKFWEKAAGKKFADRSKPYSMLPRHKAH